MNKLDITKSLASKDEKYSTDPKYINMLYRAWWTNWRDAEDRRFRLTDKGYEYFHEIAEIKFYDIRFPMGLVITNKMIIDLDRFIDCPYYITPKGILVTGEKVAVQLVLFDGDLSKFGRAKRETRQRKLKN
jgi:hypothetical protein